MHTDSWLLAVAFFHAAKLDKAAKKKLYEKCSELPTLYETITGKEKVVWGPKNKLGNKRPPTKVPAQGKVRARARPPRRQHPPLLRRTFRRTGSSHQGRPAGHAGAP